MRQAAAHGLRTVALTDHDRTSGWQEAAEETRRLGMTFVPGMEMSAVHGWRSVHVLAYLFDPESAPLKAECARIREDRIGRAERMVKRIGHDYDISWSHVISQAEPGATIGRPHIADALVAQGIVPDRGAAFAGVLHPREGYYEPHYAPDPLVAVQLIVAAGGVPIIAHPVTTGRDRMMPLDFYEQLIEAGLAGVELGHRENTDEGRRLLQVFADSHDLIVTGSSDYHGAGKPNVPGEHTTTDRMLQRIIERATGTSPVYADN